ncbi:MAG: NAD-dependent dihydropyrimidine dehydrogenase PreA subunit [Planctomycetota bacterium]|jgi:NAD-dependent dihydropyrimidine dehydrogenase PreA subunit
MRIADHPSIVKFKNQQEQGEIRKPSPIDSAWLKELVLKAGADDVGFVQIDRQEVADQREDILAALPRTKTLISYVVKVNQEPIRTPARSIANLEFHHGGDQVNEVGRKVVSLLQGEGIKALNPAMGFPMEMDKFPGKVWTVSHKPVAVAAGLGMQGIHRLVIHPKFGNFVLLGTLLIDSEVTAYDMPIDYNPCVECKLCVQACPVGAIQKDGDFNFSACYTHNYREFMGGFTDWTEQVVNSKDHLDYRKKVNDSESASMWQSLSFGANYKAAYCMAVCPAGDDVIGPFLEDRRAHADDYLHPLQSKDEVIFVMKGTDAESHVAKRFPNKTIKHVGNSLRSRTIAGFSRGLSLVFQPNRSKGLAAAYHFRFSGSEQGDVTVVIKDQRIVVSEGLVGVADLEIRADLDSWLGFLAKEKSLVWSLLRRKIKLKGPAHLLVAFGKCFPS